jgi:uncharacterized protein YjiS (DUF1127 family)
MNILQMWKDYKFHKNANWAADKLRMHSDKDLKDIGITRGDINRAAHHKCPWCMRWELVGDGKGL